MTQYTSSDIEIHLSEMLEGMPTDGVDVDASNERAGNLIEAAIRAQYPQYDVSVYTQQAQLRWFDAAGYPNDVEPEELEEIAEAALGDDSGSQWIVLLETDGGSDGDESSWDEAAFQRSVTETETLAAADAVAQEDAEQLAEQDAIDREQMRLEAELDAQVEADEREADY